MQTGVSVALTEVRKGHSGRSNVLMVQKRRSRKSDMAYSIRIKLMFLSDDINHRAIDVNLLKEYCFMINLIQVCRIWLFLRFQADSMRVPIFSSLSFWYDIA